MTRYELSLSPKYVSSWGPWEALREIWQNVLDETEGEESRAVWVYNKDKRLLTIGNDGPEISSSTLLMGNTTKSESPDKIGQYGEGYKLALLILLREGFSVVIRNGKVNWTPKIRYSNKFQSDILVIDETTERVMWSGVYYDIHGINPSFLEDIKDKFLKLASDDVLDIKNNIHTPYGTIMFEPSVRGKVFVRGLFVCDMLSTGLKRDKIAFGYDVNPAYIQLDRDRHKVSEFNLFWETSRMIHWYMLNRDEIHNERHINMTAYNLTTLIDKKYDAQYIHAFGLPQQGLVKDVCDMSFREFLKEYGRLAVPVKDEAEAEMIRKKFKNRVPVMLPEVKYLVVTASESYANHTKTYEVTKVTTPHSVLKKFYDEFHAQMPVKMNKSYRKLMERSMNWFIIENKPLESTDDEEVF
jgi:hypothetical protein